MEAPSARDLANHSWLEPETWGVDRRRFDVVSTFAQLGSTIKPMKMGRSHASDAPAGRPLAAAALEQTARESPRRPAAEGEDGKGVLCWARAARLACDQLADDNNIPLLIQLSTLLRLQHRLQQRQPGPAQSYLQGEDARTAS